MLWAERTRVDLRAMHDTLAESHPGPLDEENPAFRVFQAEGLSAGLSRAHEVTSYEGYVFALRRYAAGFRDGHLSVSSSPRLKASWPGFVVTYREGGYFVHGEPDEPDEKDGAARAGDRLIACDGVSIEERMRRDVFPYGGNPSLAASYPDKAPLLLVDLGNPDVPRARACHLERGSSKVTIRLNWSPIDEAKLWPLVEAARFGAPSSFGMKTLASGIEWVSLPTFKPKSDADTIALRGAVRRAADLRRSRAIVFDVRGNRGGNSQWAEDIVAALYGDAYVTFRKVREGLSTAYADWRVSTENIAHLRALLPKLEAESGAESPIVEMVRDVARDMTLAAREGRAYVAYHDPPPRLPEGGEAPESPVSAQVFLLTDGRCGSSCLDFADLLFAMGNVRHIGEPTNADTTYGDVRGVSLPSGFSRLTFAMKVIRGRPRGNNEPYVPAEVYSGSTGLEAWVEGLVLRGRVNAGK